MSGPKLIELRRMRAARERQQNLDQCASRSAEYQRLLLELEAWGQRLCRLGLSVRETVPPFERVRAETEALLRQGAHHEAARILGESVGRLRGVLDQQREQFQQRLVELHNRHRQLLQDCETIASERPRLTKWLDAAMPAAWPEPEKVRLRKLLESGLQQPAFAAPANVPDTSETITAFEQVETAARSSLAALQATRQQLAAELHATRIRLLAPALTAHPLPASPPLAAVLQRFTAAPEAVVAENTSWTELDTALARLAALSEDGLLQDFRRRAAQLRAEPDAARRRILAEGLLIDCSARWTELRRLAQWREQIWQLINSAAHLQDAAVASVIAELRQLLEAGSPVKLEPIRQRLEEAIQAAEARREREDKRRALIDSLKALGYETREGLETAFVKAGRLVLRRPPEEEFAIELVGTSELDQVQSALVRFGDSPELSEQQKRRDREREESWCADHARLCEQLAARGLQTQFKMQFQPGEHPVRVVVEPGRQHQPAASAAPRNTRQSPSSL